MATQVVNPTNAPPVKDAALPFLRREATTSIVRTEAGPYNPNKSKPFREDGKKDAFNNGKDYQDEGSPILTSESSEGKRLTHAPAAVIVNSLIKPPSEAEMEALADPDKTSQTQIRYLKEAIVMDVDAKLIVSTDTQMRNGVFRESHYPTLVDYMKSDHYRRLRESRIRAEVVAGIASKTKLRESDRSLPVQLRYNPQLVTAYKATDARIYKKLRESGFAKDIKKLNENFGGAANVGSLGANWDGGESFGLAGREPDFVPIMSGPYNKQLYFFDYMDMHSKAFEAWTHNPVAKRIVKVITQFVLGKGVKLTVMRAVPRSQEKRYVQQQNQKNNGGGANLVSMASNIASMTQQQQPQQGQRIGQGQQAPNTGQQFNDYKVQCQDILDLHWKKNKLHMRSKQILRSLLIFGEQFPRYFDAPWGLKIRQLDPSTIWEIITDPDDVENEFYAHCQYPTQYQWYVDLPVPTIKFIIRQVPSNLYYHMKINTVEGEKRGRSELFVILGWLKRLKEFASDRVVRNKMANLFVLDVAVEGDAAAVQQIQTQFATPPTPGSFFIHNKAAEMNGISAEVGASDTSGDWELLLTIAAMGAGISKTYLGMGESAGGKAGAMIGTEPDIKTFEDYQELMEDFFHEDAARVYERAKERNEIPQDLSVVVEATFPALAEENRSEKLKDLAFMESMSWVSHRRTASAAAKEMQMTSYDYDDEQMTIASEDAMKQFLINTAYQQVTKGVDSAQQKAAGAGGTDSGSSGKGASGMGPGKALPSGGSSSSSTGESEAEEDWELEEAEEAHLDDFSEDEDEGLSTTAHGTSSATNISSQATTHNASRGDKQLPEQWRGKNKNGSYKGFDPRDVAGGIKREAANLRYERRAIGRKQDRVQTPNKVRDQKSRDRGEVLNDARTAIKHGKLNKETDGHPRFPRLDPSKN